MLQLFTQRPFYMRIFDILCFQIHWSTLYAPVSLITCSLLGDRSLLKQKKKDRPSQRDTRLPLLRSRTQRNTEIERTSLIISSSPPEPTKLLKPIKLLSWSNKVFALLLCSPSSSPVSGTKAWSVQCPWASLSLPTPQYILPSPRLGQAIFHESPLAREGSILLDTMAALICAFSSVNCECDWPEQCLRWGLTHALEEDSNSTKRTGEKKYNRLINMEKLNYRILSLCPKIEFIASKMCIYPILLYHIYQNVKFAALFIIWHLKTLFMLPSFLFFLFGSCNNPRSQSRVNGKNTQFHHPWIFVL